MTLYNKKYYFLLLAAFAIIILPHIYYGDGRILNSGDYAWTLDFVRFFELVVSTWDDSYAFGMPAPRQHASLLFSSFGSLLTQFDFSHATIQSIFFSVSVAIGAYGTVQLGKIFAWSDEQSVIFSLLYLLSSISLHYWSPDHGLNIFAYYWLPATIALALKFLITKNLFFLVSFFLISLNPSFSNPSFFIIYMASLLFFLFISKDVLPNINKINLKLSRKALIIFIFLVANLYWLLPFVLDIKQQFHSASNAISGLISDYKIAVQDSSTFSYAILGNGGGMWTAYAEHAPGTPIRLWGEYIRSNLFIFFNILVVLISILSLFYGRIEKKHIIFLGAYLFLIVLISGLKYTFPINLVPDLFLEIPGFERGFRSLFMKLGILLALFSSIVMSYSVKTPYKKVTYIFIFLLSLPYLTAVNYVENNNARPPEYMMPPVEYDILRQISVASNNDFPPSLILLPFNKSSYNINLRWADGGYVGSEFLRMYWHGPVKSYDDGSNGSKKIIENCGDNVSTECIRYLLEHGNSFFLIRNDNYNDKNRSNNIKNKLSDMESLGILKTVEQNQYFHLFKGIETTDNSAHFLSINCQDSKDPSSGTRVNGSLIEIHSTCDNPEILKYGNHVNSWWLCDGNRYQKNINNSLFVDKQKIDIVNKYVGDIGCSIAYRALEALSPTLKDNGRYIVYFAYIGFIVGLIISIITLLIVTALASVQLIKNKA